MRRKTSSHSSRIMADATAALHERAIEGFDEGLGTYRFATAGSHRPTM